MIEGTLAEKAGPKVSLEETRKYALEEEVRTLSTGHSEETSGVTNSNSVSVGDHKETNHAEGGISSDAEGTCSVLVGQSSDSQGVDSSESVWWCGED